MPLFLRRGRFLAVGLGLTLGFGGTASATDIFFGHHKGHKDSRGLSRAVGAPTIFMPASAPAAPTMMGLCTMPAPARELTGLEKALEAEHHAIMAESARAAFRAEVEGKQRLLQKLGTGSGTASALPADVESRLQAIAQKLDQLSTRLSDVERLLIVHDNYLQEMYKQWPPGTNLPIPAHSHEPEPPKVDPPKVDVPKVDVPKLEVPKVEPRKKKKPGEENTGFVPPLPSANSAGNPVR